MRENAITLIPFIKFEVECIIIMIIFIALCNGTILWSYYVYTEF